MARVQKDSWPVLKASQLNKPNVFVVDMINGFTRQGALADPAIADIAGPIADLLDATGADAWFIRDSHSPDAAEFSSFPVHCLAGSEESEVIDVLKPYVDEQRVICKNTISAAAVDGFFEKIAAIEDGSDLIITGCCTDLCVAQLALPLQFWIMEHGRNLRVIVVVNCVDTYDIKDTHSAKKANETALNYMNANGVTVVSHIETEKETNK